MNEEDKRIFAKNLRHYMARDKVNGVTVAAYMKVSSATVSDWTSGKKMPRVDKIKSLANYFRIDMSDLTDDKDAYKEVPEILQLYNRLNEQYQDELIQYAGRLFQLQLVEKYNTQFKQMVRKNQKKGKEEL